VGLRPRALDRPEADLARMDALANEMQQFAEDIRAGRA
jgi:hypothetical protein